MKLTRIFALILCLMLGVSGVFGAQLNDKRLTLLDKKERLVGFEDKIVVLFSVFCSHCYAHFKQGSWELIAGIDPRVKVEQWQMLQAVEGGDDYAMWAYARKLDEARGIDMFKQTRLNTNLRWRILGRFSSRACVSRRPFTTSA